MNNYYHLIFAAALPFADTKSCNTKQKSSSGTNSCGCYRS